MRNRRVVLAAVLFVVAAVPATAQITYDGCRDLNGFSVASVRNDYIPDIAMATIWNGNPVIFYNVGVLSWVSAPTRLFFYAHECAHHKLGHTLGASHPLKREQEADCWAIRTLVGERRISEPDYNAIQYDLARFATGDWSHLPGPVRAINLNGCLSGQSTQAPPPPPPRPLYCCNGNGFKVCQVGTSPPSPTGASCWCAGMPYGITCW